jgi:hypothetical protein
MARAEREKFAFSIAEVTDALALEVRRLAHERRVARLNLFVLLQRI